MDGQKNESPRPEIHTIGVDVENSGKRTVPVLNSAFASAESTECAVPASADRTPPTETPPATDGTEVIQIRMEGDDDDESYTFPLRLPPPLTALFGLYTLSFFHWLT